jgi:amino acid transporter
MLQIFQALILFFTYSLILVFPFLREEQIVLDISIFSMVFYIFEVVMNLFVVREKEGKKITKV